MTENYSNIKPFLEQIIKLEIQKSVSEISIEEIENIIQEAEENEESGIHSAESKTKCSINYRSEKKKDEAETKKEKVKKLTFMLVLLSIILVFLDYHFLLLIPPIIFCSIFSFIIIKLKLKKEIDTMVLNLTNDQIKEISDIKARYAYRHEYNNELEILNNDLISIKRALYNLRYDIKKSFPIFNRFLSLDCIVHLYDFFEAEGYETDVRMCLEELSFIVKMDFMKNELDKRNQEIDAFVAEVCSELEDIYDEIKVETKRLRDYINVKCKKLETRTESIAFQNYIQVLELCDLINNRNE